LIFKINKNQLTLDENWIGMLENHVVPHVVDVHGLSMWLLIKIFHQLHRRAINFELIKRPESFVVYNVFDVVVVELLMQNLTQEYPKFI
jgi:hypothetical protein